MYYEKKKNNFYGIALILLLLLVIILILISLTKRLDANYWMEAKKSEPTGTDTVLTEFNLQDLAKNASYSIVRNIKIK